MQRLPSTPVEQRMKSLDPCDRAAAREKWHYPQLSDPCFSFIHLWRSILRYLLRVR